MIVNDESRLSFGSGASHPASCPENLAQTQNFGTATTMIIKQADDKAKRLAMLAALKQSPRLNARQRDWLDGELLRLRRGIEGEREAAFYIDSYLKDHANRAVIHDLRLEVDGDVAQIDHLIVNRMLNFKLIETKCFGGDVSINEHGEFSVRYANGKRYGIPSPLEQSKRHERIISKVLDQLGISGRLGVKPTFTHLVMLHPKATIERPATCAIDTSLIIKADALPSWYEREQAKDPTLGEMVGGLLSIRSRDTLAEWAQALAQQHRPADLLALPDFMAPTAEPVPAPPMADAPDESLRRKLVCVTCGAPISFAEGKFCWNNEKRFGGFQYCRVHQSR
ncbi:MAG: hypothetical protein RI907_2168 [Pseudomonadota bacterium]